MRIIARPDSTPLVTMRVVFRAGSAQDPAGEGGTAWLTALMLTDGGSRSLTYKQILDHFFPMGVSVSSQVGHELTAFSAATHVDHLDSFYRVFREMLLEPGWRQEDFERLLDDTVNYLEVGLRGQNDEELAKELFYQRIFRRHPFERYSAGSVSSLARLTVRSLREFYLAHYAQDNLMLGIAGSYPPEFEQRLRKDFHALPLKSASPVTPPAAQPLRANQLLMVEKQTRSVAISLGFPIEVRRGHPDYPALLLASSCLGQHRMSSGRLFTRMRQLRGLNYGDYAYIEYFPGGMYTLEQPPHSARSSEAFQIWIRPVERHQAHFALRLALHELQKLVDDGLSEEEFSRGRRFLSKYVWLLLRGKSQELGYAIDSEFFGIDEYPLYLREGLKGLTLGDVNAAIRRHLRWDRLQIVMVGEGMAELKDQIVRGDPSPITYTSPKPEEILAEDRIVENRWIEVTPDAAVIMPAGDAFA